MTQGHCTSRADKIVQIDEERIKKCLGGIVRCSAQETWKPLPDAEAGHFGRREIEESLLPVMARLQGGRWTPGKNSGRKREQHPYRTMASGKLRGLEVNRAIAWDGSPVRDIDMSPFCLI
jgi:hypothetical protein